ncbi:formate dehydrogenase accessory protein FdhE [Ferrimonas aestuarii]|uniref:Protein FdhE homolog n=1 Tax=Ferrimonas aestuarii TaxID=2569539 RepID=A0A4V5NYL8_9GAMM|nr:formate dehydrogenase accessory protein FdhE [Ferrimonas aestuarii]TKB54974.1 formate dehydrogenase accessory protein FdhE [Ferrimonas aestuarii]
MTQTADIPVTPLSESPLELKTLLAAAPLELYQHRAKRLETLTSDSPLADYLELCRRLALVQADLAANADFGPSPITEAQASLKVIGPETDVYWQGVLQQLLAKLLLQTEEPIARVVRLLMQQSQQQIATWGRALRQGQISQVPAQFSLFLWAAMGVYWSHWAPLVIKRMDLRQIEQQPLCPVCGSHPVASVIKDEPRAGLRYLHCSLCESEWHFIRAHCSNCGQDKEMSLWSMDDHQAKVRVESCDECHGYTKMLFVGQAPEMDAVADDLATLVLDAQLSEQGFVATTTNPMLLAHEADGSQ